MGMNIKDTRHFEIDGGRVGVGADCRVTIGVAEQVPSCTVV